MKNIISYNKYFHNINENINQNLFKNKELLFNSLIQDNDFANGDIYQGLVNVFFKEWNNNESYDDVCKKIENKYGKFAKFLLQFGMYNAQVNNGGHSQYYDNGYASYGSTGFGQTYGNIDLHYDLYILFKKFNFDDILTNGKELGNILSRFELDMVKDDDNCWECDGEGHINCDSCNGDSEIECEECGGTGQNDENNEDCSNCVGEGYISCDKCRGEGKETCPECDGSGFIESDEEYPETFEWGALDKLFYSIGENVMEEIENYLKNLTLKGEKIKDIAKIAKEKNKYNI